MADLSVSNADAHNPSTSFVSATTATTTTATQPMFNGNGNMLNGASNNHTLPPLGNSNYDYYSLDDKTYIPIPQFYAGRSVFITGGTGFMGKVLVEKLLRSCPDIKNIYLLIRPKRGQEVSARLAELLDAPLFESLRKEKPKELRKIVPIRGDITADKLGISESDQALLCRNVSIVFHSAATVKFDEKLKLSVTINMLGTKRLVELCHRMMSLDALIHVSTAYCNCDRSDVSEILYAPPYNPDDIISLVNWLPEEIIDKLTPSLIDKRPNTYTFTKALAEHMLLKEAGNLPVAIVRPSIVISSLNEPVAGWIDNFNGPTGIISALAKGLMRTMLCAGEYVADLVPVDIVINLMIAAAWRTATRKPDNLLIYNCCSGQRNPIKWKDFVKYAKQNVRNNPLEDSLWYPAGSLRTSKVLNTITQVVSHMVPAYLLDGFSILTGRKPIMVKIRTKLHKAICCLEYFSTRQWDFRDDNVHSLLHVLSPKDRENFMFDVTRISWENYVQIYVLGLREFLFKQKPETLPASRRRMMRLYYLHQLTKVLMVIFTWRFLMARSKRLNEAWSAFLENIFKIARMMPFL